MKLLRLLPIGKVDAAILQGLCVAIPKRMNVRCEIVAPGLDPTVAYHAERQQYHSSEILGRMQAFADAQSWRVLGIGDVDLYIPILKYVFGEAQMGGPCAVVSLYRLRQEFYGLERDDALLGERLLKECIHELGHTLDLRHCQDYRCAMASAHAVEWIDLRESTLCEACRGQVRAQAARRSRLPFARSANSPLP
jgi:archaemetzincin